MIRLYDINPSIQKVTWHLEVEGVKDPKGQTLILSDVPKPAAPQQEKNSGNAPPARDTGANDPQPR